MNYWIYMFDGFKPLIRLEKPREWSGIKGYIRANPSRVQTTMDSLAFPLVF